MWKQRHLTLFGKKILIQTLINSLFIFNSQIEFPPTDFLPLVDKKCKQFLWDSQTAKVAHHSIIADAAKGENLPNVEISATNRKIWLD